MAQGISANGNELEGFLQLRSSSSPSAVLQQVYCELTARRLEVLLFDYLVFIYEVSLLCHLAFPLRFCHFVDIPGIVRCIPATFGTRLVP